MDPFSVLVAATVFKFGYGTLSVAKNNSGGFSGASDYFFSDQRDLCLCPFFFFGRCRSGSVTLPNRAYTIVI